MARTPLLRSLLRLAAEHRAASRAGVPVDAVREERERASAVAAARGLTRRELIAGAVAAAAALGLPAWARAQAAVPRPRPAPAPSPAANVRGARVGIVGGGMAGLTAALALVDAGHAPTVFEATPRLGGRMKSEGGSPRRFGCATCHDAPPDRLDGPGWEDGQVTDLFGEFVDSGHETMIALADRFRLRRIDLLAAEPPGATETYMLRDVRYPKRDADRDYRRVQRAVARDLVATKEETTWEALTPEGRRLDRMSVQEWIASRVPGGHDSPMGQLLDTAYTIEFGADTADQSALNLVFLLGYDETTHTLDLFGASDERYRIADGAEALPRAIAGHLEGRCDLQLGREIAAVARLPDGAVELTFQGGKAERFDVVVLALPFAALRRVSLDRAGFDARKLRAIRELGYGRNGKLQLQFSRRLWTEPGPWGTSAGGSYSDTGYQATWEATRGQPGVHGILVNYTGGRTAEAMGMLHPYATAEEERVRAASARFLSQVEPVYPGLRALWNGRAACGMPHLNRFWGGSYSYYRVGQYGQFGGHEPVRQGNVFFAGEHCTQEAQGYMEGAALTGKAAGEAVAKHWPELGRFVSADSYGGSYADPASLNRYSYVHNNPYSYTDPMGHAPNQAGATDWHHVGGALASKTLSELSASKLGNDARYFYTDRYGWIDIRHFGAAAAEVREKGKPGFLVKALGYGVEVQQWFSEGAGAYRSAFSPEDLPSNSAGISFAESIGEGESLPAAFARWALEAGAKDLGDSGYERLPSTDPSRPAATTGHSSSPWSVGNPNSGNPQQSSKERL
jgi:monoamine oxidase